MPDNSFPRSSRLLKKGDYDKVFKNPVRVSAPGVVVLAIKNDCGHARLGLVVSKRTLRRAAWRNLVKRIAREAFRTSQDSLPSADLVVIAKSGIREIGKEQLSANLKRLWDQISRRLKNRQF